MRATSRWCWPQSRCRKLGAEIYHRCVASANMKLFLRQFAISFGIWTVIGVLDGFYNYGGLKARGEIAGTYGIFRDALGFHWLWAVFTLPIFWFTRRFPVRKPNLWLSVLAHLGFFLAISLLYAAAAELLGLWVQPVVAQTFHLPRILYRWITAGFGYLWVYVVLVGAWHLGDFYHKYKDRETRAARLQAELATAQLEVLRAQIHPHFLFNTLNSISALMQEDVQAADDMLADLSFMLRASLEASTTQEIDLESEIDLLATYLRIQKRRFEDRLAVDIQVEETLFEARVPCLLLQPFVENSIRHGIVPQSRPGRVEITASRRDDQLVLQIADDGLGLPARYQEGIGLTNTRARLKHLYGERQSVTLTNRQGGGAVAVITLPFRTEIMEGQEGRNYELQNLGSGRRASGPPSHPVAAEG
jgi:two-component system, LytTR family, sensor kinase